MIKPLSRAQDYAARKAKHRQADTDRAEQSLATNLLAGKFDKCKGGLGRGWKKWAKKVIK